MAGFTYSVPDGKDSEKLNKHAKVLNYIRKFHINRSALITDLLIKWGEEKGVFDEERD